MQTKLQTCKICEHHKNVKGFPHIIICRKRGIKQGILKWCKYFKYQTQKIKKHKMANENQNMEKLKAVEISTGQIVLPPLPEIDVTPYIGTKAKIVQAIVVKSPFINKKTGEEQYSLYVKTETVGTIGDGENKVELSGSKFFGLYKDEDRNIGWADNTICGQFMKKMGCNQKEQLIGKEVTLQKNNKGYLTLV